MNTTTETGGSNITSTNEEDTFLDTISENADTVKETLTTDPREWTQAQIIGVAVGAAVALILVGVLCYCCRRRRRRGGGGGGGSGSKTMEKPVPMQRPYVTRSTGSAVDSEKK